jgi:signal transduction histidine kinase
MGQFKHLTGSRGFAWVAVGLLAVLCGVVAFLQYSWIGEISVSERQRLEEALQDRLSRVQRAFNAEVQGPITALIPDADQIAAVGRDRAYEARYEAWKQTHGRVFRNIALAIPQAGSGLVLEQLNLNDGRFKPASWSRGWEGMRRNLNERLEGPGPLRGGPEMTGPFQLEVPRFGRGPGEPGREQEWLLLEFDPGYLRQTLFPALLRRLLTDSGSVKYDVAVVTRTFPVETIYESAPNVHLAGSQGQYEADASIPLLGAGPELSVNSGRAPRRPPPPRRSGEGDEGAFQRSRPPRPPGGPGPRDGGPGGGGRWLLLAWHRAGSLEALVERTRRRNLALSGGLLLLILGTAAALVHYSRQAQKLAEARMNFVAGVSHELRTPLTVIRTASFNLTGKLAHKPDQVERYGKLIQGEAVRLSALVEQVLSFANAKAGSLLRNVSAHSVAPLIDRSLAAARVHFDPTIEVVTNIPADLSMILADELALTHALENLIDNAAKHGGNAEPWIGVFARDVEDRGKKFVEISVVDHGLGIPREEQRSIFEPFYRGRRAMEDQVRGTGLGLDLVKKIAEAHGGSIRVISEPPGGDSAHQQRRGGVSYVGAAASGAMRRTEFILRLPAEPRSVEAPNGGDENRVTEAVNEFAHPAD